MFLVINIEKKKLKKLEWDKLSPDFKLEPYLNNGIG